MGSLVPRVAEPGNLPSTNPSKAWTYNPLSEYYQPYQIREISPDLATTSYTPLPAPTNIACFETDDLAPRDPNNCDLRELGHPPLDFPTGFTPLPTPVPIVRD